VPFVHEGLGNSSYLVEVAPGQAVLVSAGEWVQYTTPEIDGADYVSVCVPAFSPGLVHRDE